MKKDENFEWYKRKWKLNGWIQYLFKFKNLYWLSVVRHNFSYWTADNLWEIWFIKRNNNEYKLERFEEFWDSVKWYLCENEVNLYIEKIKAL